MVFYIKIYIILIENVLYWQYADFSIITISFISIITYKKSVTCMQMVDNAARNQRSYQKLFA